MDAVASIKEMALNQSPEEVLQTRIVSQHEVRRHLEPIKSELKALFETKKALKPIDAQLVQQLVAEGKAEILPSNPIPATELERRKPVLSLVGLLLKEASLNCLPVEPQHGFSTRLVWSCLCIRTAFLTAPMKLGASENLETGEHADLKIAIIKPPPLLILAGLAKPDEYWQVLMALYGYKESPRLWADYRDQEIHKMKVDMHDGSALALQQMVTEPNMWRIVKYTPGPFDATQAEQFCGILIIYVDDLLLLGEPAVLDSLVDTIQSKWGDLFSRRN